MAKKQIIMISVVFDEEEVRDVACKVDDYLFNVDGILEWKTEIKKEETLEVLDTDFEIDEEE